MITRRSSFIDLDLKDYTRKDIRCCRGTSYPNEVINHHAPLTPRSTQSTGLFKSQKNSFFKRASNSTIWSLRRVECRGRHPHRPDGRYRFRGARAPRLLSRADGSARALCALRTTTGRGKISTERASGGSRGADMPRWIVPSSSRRRRTRGTRNSVAGWVTWHC